MIIEKRGTQRQNETAKLLADEGCDIEMLPEDETNTYGLKEKSKPDYLIEGEVYDCYSPSTGNMNTIRKEISGKTKEQAPNIVMNLDDSPLSIEQLVDNLKGNKITRLKKLIVIKDGKVVVVDFS